MSEDRFRARAHWTDTKTGQTGVYVDKESGGGSIGMDCDIPARISDFMWCDGNYACDCNRGLFFLNSDEDFPCSEKRFVITKLEALRLTSDQVVHVWDNYESVEPAA